MELMLNCTNMPNVDIGNHCSSPNGCDFQGHCWSHIPNPSIFNLYWMNSNKKFEMYYKGLRGYEDIPNDFGLNATQQLQVETYKSKEAYINKTIIKDFLNTIQFPINFFDFETFQNAIPRFNNQRPYMQIPFQYSLHILHEDGTLEHKEFLGDENRKLLRTIDYATSSASMERQTRIQLGLGTSEDFWITGLKEKKYEDEFLTR
jgi:hypothetical protein